MKDPTQANRDTIKNFIGGVLPKSSPLSQSIEADKAEAKAAELEAQAQTERAKAAEQRAKEEASMMSQGQPAQVPAAAPLEQAQPAREVASEAAPIAPAQPSLSRGQALEAQTETQLGQEESAAIGTTQAEIQKKQAEAEAQRKIAQEAIDASIKDIESTKIEPKSFYDGKTTGEKITAGIGLFLASLTPEGAANAQRIIQNSIDRDIDAQKANLGKKQNTLSALKDKLGSIDAAEAAFRVQALQGLDLQLKQKAATAKGPMVKAKLMQAQEKMQAEAEGARQKLGLELMKIKGTGKEQSDELTINAFGFIGKAPSKEEAKTFRKELADTSAAKEGIAQLIDLAKKGSKLSLEDRARAKTIASMTVGKLRTTIVGPGAVSESEWALLRDIVANPTEITRLDSQTITSLSEVNARLDSGLKNVATSMGIQRQQDKFDQFKRPQ